MTAEAPAVLLCGDVGAMLPESGLGALVAGLRRRLPGIPVSVIPDLCGGRHRDDRPTAPPAHIPQRVVAGCARAREHRQDITARLRSARVPAGGIAMVELRAVEGLGEAAFLEEAIALFGAAAAFVSRVDLDVPSRDRTIVSDAEVSRRQLFHGELARRPVAVWRPNHCGPAARCAACVLACPYGALTRSDGHIVVRSERCTGCGICVAACSRHAFVLNGAALDASGAAVAQLVDAANDIPGAGVAVVCEQAPEPPLVGDRWLAMRVPSLEMVSSGWLLQLASAGVAVRLVGCDDAACRQRGRALEQFTADLWEALAAAGISPGAGPTPPHRSSARGPASPVLEIELSEPEATVGALESIGALRADRAHWRAAGPGCALGHVDIDPNGCSGCEACVAVCPTSALQSGRDEHGSLRLTFDPRRCTACGACVNSCPESVVTLQRQADGVMLAAGRRVVATVSTAACSACGAPLLAGLSPAVMRRRLGADHPAMSGATAGLCAACRLAGRHVQPVSER